MSLVNRMGISCPGGVLNEEKESLTEGAFSEIDVQEREKGKDPSKYDKKRMAAAIKEYKNRRDAYDKKCASGKCEEVDEEEITEGGGSRASKADRKAAEGREMGKRGYESATGKKFPKDYESQNIADHTYAVDGTRKNGSTVSFKYEVPNENNTNKEFRNYPDAGAMYSENGKKEKPGYYKPASKSHPAHDARVAYQKKKLQEEFGLEEEEALIILSSIYEDVEEECGDSYKAVKPSDNAHKRDLIRQMKKEGKLTAKQAEDAKKTQLK